MALNLLRQTSLQHAIINTAAGGTVTIASPIPGTYCRIYRVIAFPGAALTYTFQDTASNALSSPYSTAMVLDITISGDPWFQATAQGLGLQISLSAAVQFSADIWYLQLP